MDRAGERRLAALAFAIPFLAYLPTLAFGFVWDDIFYYRDNLWIRDWSNLRPLVSRIEPNATHGVAAVFWRPLRNISYLVDWSIAGGRAWWPHLVNALWHGAACAGLFALARRLGLGAAGALVAALAFGLHPAQAESAAWIKERDGLMAAAFALWALAAALGGGARGIAAFLWLFALALLSKENAVVVPALLAAALWLRPGGLAPTRGQWAAAAASLLLCLTYLYIRAQVVGATSQQAGWIGGGLAPTLWTMGAAFLEYLRIALTGTGMKLDYGHWKVAGAGDWAPWAGFAALAALLAAAHRLRRAEPLAALGAAWFLLALAPYANLVPMMQWMAVRFLYFPLAGAAIAAGWTYERHLVPRTGRHALFAGAALALLAAGTLAQLPMWRSNFALWAAEHARNPDNHTVRVYHANELLDTGRAGEASAILSTVDLSTAIGKRATTWLTLARARELSGDDSGARAAIEDGLARFGPDPGLLAASGRLHAQAGDLDAAEREWLRAIAVDPNNLVVRSNLERLAAIRAEQNSP
ncbi:MAG: hypothetical protein SF028_15475 [Candidatus Sumerlaeia bacterium]|nr:hypothetical protein [Candidatus Sumerlaeia bacterium]